LPKRQNRIPLTIKEQERALRQAEEQLRAERRAVREHQRQEDEAWRIARCQPATALNSVEKKVA